MGNMAETEHLSASVEDYLEAIYWVVKKNQAALPRDIRKILKVGRSSVSGALKHLTERGLIQHESYGVITLTVRGEEIAREVVRKHEILKQFFMKVLRVDDTKAGETACVLEHSIDDEVLKRFLAYADYVSRCPQVNTQWVEGMGFLCSDFSPEKECRVLQEHQNTESSSEQVSSPACGRTESVSM